MNSIGNIVISLIIIAALWIGYRGVLHVLGYLPSYLATREATRNLDPRERRLIRTSHFRDLTLEERRELALIREAELHREDGILKR
jgi:hypothetical protein